MKRKRLVLWIAFLVGASGSISAEDVFLSELENSFERDLVSVWYPRSVDTAFGGYVTGFAGDWSPTKETDKFLVGQARHIWVLSRLAGFKDDEAYAEQARHGMRHLVDVMWDRECGGFYEGVTQEGEPMTGFGKSAYGMSFSIYALAALYSETKDEEALEYAKKAFYWLEEHSWDKTNDGYVDDLNLEGEWLPKRIDGFDGDRLGAKDYNSTIHILESYTELYSVWPDAALRNRLEQMLEIVRDRFVQEPAYLQLIFDRQWRKVSFRPLGRDAVLESRFFDHVSWGHDVETAFLMLEAAEALYGHADEKTASTAKALVDHALETGWDAALGSLYEGGYYFDENGALEVIMPEKVWWIAAESLNANLLMSQLYPDEAKYYEAFVAQWAYIKKNMIDDEHRGWLATGLDSDAGSRDLPKAFRWKASYHDARAYMNCIEMLRGEFPLTRRE